MELHASIEDLMDSMPMPDSLTTLMRVQVTPIVSRSSVASRTSEPKSLFQDYFNHNQNEVQSQYNELEAYIAVKIPNVCRK